MMLVLVLMLAVAVALEVIRMMIVNAVGGDVDGKEVILID